MRSSYEHERDSGNFERRLKLVVGAFLVVFDAFWLYLDARKGETVTWEDVSLHLGLLIGGLLLMAPDRTLKLIGDFLRRKR